MNPTGVSVVDYNSVDDELAGAKSASNVNDLREVNDAPRKTCGTVCCPFLGCIGSTQMGVDMTYQLDELKLYAGEFPTGIYKNAKRGAPVGNSPDGVESGKDEGRWYGTRSCID